MDEKLTQAKEIIEKYNQPQLEKAYQRLTTEEEKQKFLDNILTIDFKQIEKLYEGTKEKKAPEGNAKIEPIEYVDKNKMSEDTKTKFREIGEKEIKSGKLAVVTMAGGQGTRLGHTGPKGTFDLGLESHKSIFEILTDTLREAHEKYNVSIPWYIMTSDENNKQTTSFFEEHDYFGYPKQDIIFFKQGKLPMCSTEGKILVDENGQIKEAADGHGGIFKSLAKDGMIYDMKARGIEWVFIGGVDNVLVKPVDPILMGLAIDKNVLAAGKSLVKASPEEKVGVFCKKNGRPSVVEYTEISDEMAHETDENGELKYGESHILCNLFNIKALEKISEDDLPYHVAFKKAKYIDENGELVVPDAPNAYKFEAFLFDAFEDIDDMVIMRVNRNEEFAPVKNKEGDDSPATARELYKNFHKGE